MARTILLMLLSLGALAPELHAELLEVRPVADTTLHAISPANNLGGHSHVAIGSTAKSTPARGLFRFDLTAIPTNAVVTSVSITVTLPSLNRIDLTNAPYAIHRMFKPWGEGTKVGNLGALGTAGEATWQSSAVPTPWAAPGADDATDSALIPSATQNLGPAPGVFTVQSTSGLVADVQDWVAHPNENFGWLLRAEDESVAQTARQIASRETGDGALLRVEYTLPGAAELRITTIERVNTNVVIRWTGSQGTVALEKEDELNGSWTKIGESGDGSFTNALTGTRAFFRLAAE